MIDDLFRNNREWAEARRRLDADFFPRLARQQAPAYLWIGCADSRVPANEIVGLDPGELFVHRNIANQAPATDINYLAVLAYAVDVLRVRHVIVCGHYGCGGIRAALRDERQGLVEHWLAPVRDTMARHRGALADAPDEVARTDLLAELNVRDRVGDVAATLTIQDAWRRGQPVAVHGWIYAVADGLLRDLQVSRTGPAPDPA